MKKTAITFLLFLSVLSSYANSNSENESRSISDLSEEEKKEAILHYLSSGDCEWNGIKLYGKVKFVDSFPDIKIKYVDSFPDIKVKFVNSFPDKCGKWQVVESFPDIKIQVVESFPDLKVKVVDSFPGM
ncbi:hypothetical protein [Aureibacter tunicatorum]|uniref:7(1) septoil knot domain-containing protein n=1 Tax=Aureibacter tunicatorum TaxID=866807 RepID=A0AAE3XJX4_9BACT|nr:hypothetical protein [Aureibacter tunicatorum]MDR6238262.1 hypothetical protein [Aureibacter tunicatorum]BDD03295.1 hypothetical protein AUTU_07780 [Aureibacter tunicatorum]